MLAVILFLSNFFLTLHIVLDYGTTVFMKHMQSTCIMELEYDIALMPLHGLFFMRQSSPSIVYRLAWLVSYA